MWAAVSVMAQGCRCEQDTTPLDAGLGLPLWDVGPKRPPSREGMVWIPAGMLIAGTPPGRLPRVADEELPGTPIELGGFFIDRFSQPDEPGAIPATNVTQAEARELCERQGKRLCTELEWERACKGPDNLTHEYGHRYDADACHTGITDALSPNGSNPRCVSGFGVRDMHGSAWNWTSSAWGRGSKGSDVAIRGGNGKEGELIGRCANARRFAPRKRDAGIGVRCCAGAANTREVQLDVKSGRALSWRPPDPATAEKLAGLVPERIRQAVKDRPKADHFKVERVWVWRPIGNEELVVAGGCAHPPGHAACGVVIVRSGTDPPKVLAFASSEWWIPTIGEHESRQSLYLYGGDISGAFRKAVTYKWGRIEEGPRWRRKGRGWIPPL